MRIFVDCGRSRETIPFATQRGTIPRRPSQEDVQVATKILTKSDPEMPPQADSFPDWPKRFTKKYADWCESWLEDGLCCAHKLFEAPMPITQLQDLAGCTLLVIPETQVGSPYYNPLFMPKEALKPMYTSWILSQIVEVYRSIESLERRERFVTAMAIASGPSLEQRWILFLAGLVIHFTPLRM